MGLDSVELVLEIEKYFGIRIPYAEAEKAITVQNTVDFVSSHLNIQSDSAELREEIFARVVQFPHIVHPEANVPEATDPISNFLSSEIREE